LNGSFDESQILELNSCQNCPQASANRPIISVQFLSTFNSEERLSFPCHDNPNEFWILNQSAQALAYFPFPDMRKSNPGLAQELKEWAEAPWCPHCGPVLLQERQAPFVASHLETEIATIYRLLWANSCSMVLAIQLN
jgi:hypothetical protein